MLGFISAIMICFILPIGGVIIAARRSKKAIVIFLAGMLSFFISQMCIRLPLLQYVLPKQDWFLLMSTNPWISAVFYAFTAGLFEGLGRQAGLMVTCQKRTVGWWDGVVFGLGHGGCEAILFVGINSIVYYFTYGSSRSMDFFLASVERLCAIALHISLSVLVLYGIRKRTLWYLAVAIMLHALADGLMLAVKMLTGSIQWTLVAVALISVIYAWLAILLKRKFTQVE